MKNFDFFFALIAGFSFSLSLILTRFMRYLAGRLGVLDRLTADQNQRKIHKTAVPLLGGVAIFLAFFINLCLVREKILAGNLELHHWIGFFIGGCILMAGGFLDDKFNLSPGRQIIFPVLAALSVIAGGVGIEKITNPLGGFIKIGVLASEAFVFLWLMGMMYTTKILDGLDGLVTGVTVIGSFIIFLFTITTRYYQPDVGLAALILSAACLGFLVFNWHPAKIFLGEGGSLFLGYALGTLAIISGGKIAIALLIFGIPIMDVAWAIIRRTRAGRNPFKFSDREHLHHRLFNLGFGQRKTVLIYYFFSAAFGLSALFLQSRGKVLLLGGLVLLMFVVVVGLKTNNRESQKSKAKSNLSS